MLREEPTLLVATGLMVGTVLKLLRACTRRMSAEVINIHTIKPIDVDLLVASAQKTGRVVTVEEHSLLVVWEARYVRRFLSMLHTRESHRC